MSSRSSSPVRKLGRRAVGVFCAVLVAAGCSSPRPVEEVIPRGQLPTADLWCQLLTTEEVGTLLGEGAIERVRQVGDYRPNPDRPLPDCDVVWADEGAPVVLVESAIRRLRGGQIYLDALTNLRDLLGRTGQRLDSGDVVELQPGLYLHAPERTDSSAPEWSSLAVFLACDTGEALPTILTAGADIRATETGEDLTQEQYADLGRRLLDRTTWVHPCDGELRPLGADDWEPLVDLALDL